MMAECPLPIPMHDTFMKAFLSTDGDPDETMQKALQDKHKFGYHNGAGESYML
jgi:hypothetical protein